MKKPVVFVINEAAEKVVSCETVNVGRNGFVTAELLLVTSKAKLVIH